MPYLRPNELGDRQQQTPGYEFVLRSFLSRIAMLILVMGALNLGPASASACELLGVRANHPKEIAALYEKSDTQHIYRFVLDGADWDLTNNEPLAANALNCGGCGLLDRVLGHADFKQLDAERESRLYEDRLLALEKHGRRVHPTESLNTPTIPEFEPGDLYPIGMEKDITVGALHGYAYWYDLPESTIRKHVLSYLPVDLRILILDLHDHCSKLSIALYYEPQDRQYDFQVLGHLLSESTVTGKENADAQGTAQFTLSTPQLDSLVPALRDMWLSWRPLDQKVNTSSK